MEQSEVVIKGGSTEVNLKALWRKLWDKKIYFLISVPVCLAIAYAFVKLSTPVYEVSTSLLIDPSGNSRQLGESRFVDGGVRLVGTEKLLPNEMAKLKSFDLTRKTIDDLDFTVSYHTDGGIKKEEVYGFFPFQVKMVAASAQILDVPMYVEILSEEEYKLTVETDKFKVSNPNSNSTREVEYSLAFSNIYSFGAEVVHDYFHFNLTKSDYRVNLNEFEGKELFFEMHSAYDLANSYLEKVNVEKVDLQASILKLKTTGTVLQKEIDFLNKLTENYIKKELEDRDVVATSKESFIRNYLEGISDSLKIAERRLETFKSTTQSLDLSRSATNALDQLQRLETEKAQFEYNIKYYTSLQDYLKDSTSEGNVTIPTTLGINDPLLSENLTELNKLNTERTRLKFTQGERSYDIELVEQQIKVLKHSVSENIRTLVASTRLALNEKNRQIADIDRTLNRLPQSEKKLLNIQRKSALYENIYNYLSQELVKAGIAAAEDIPDTKTLDAPRMVGDGPVFPKPKLIYLLALMVGMLIPFGVIVMGDTLNEKILSADQIESYTSVPICASIGHFDVRPEYLEYAPNQWQVEESFRDLGASLQFILPDSENKVIGFTSTVPGEGKTFCATNLSMNFAAEGKKILLIDADLRNPSLIREASHIKGSGLSDYLQGNVEYFSEIIRVHEDLPNLHYIPTAPVDANPHKLLTSMRLKQLLLDMQAEYDYVIVDTPPVGLVSDYLLLSKYIDVHLFVVRRNFSKLSYLEDIDKLRERGKLSGMFIIFNDVNDKSFKYGYTEYRYGEPRKLLGS